MNKSILFIGAGLLSIITWILCVSSLLWVVVSFLIYLVKDIPFNWCSVWSVAIIYSIVIFGHIGLALFSMKELNKKLKNEKPVKKSAFQQKLEEMQKIQNEKLNNH